MEAGNCHIPYEGMYESCCNWNSVAVAWEQAGGVWMKTGQKRSQLWKNSLQLHAFQLSFLSFHLDFLFLTSFLTVVSVFSFISFFSSFFPPVLGIKTRGLCLLVLYYWTTSPAPGVEFLLVIGSFGKQLACHLQGGRLREFFIYSLSQC